MGKEIEGDSEDIEIRIDKDKITLISGEEDPELEELHTEVKIRRSQKSLRDNSDNIPDGSDISKN